MVHTLESHFRTHSQSNPLPTPPHPSSVSVYLSLIVKHLLQQTFSPAKSQHTRLRASSLAGVMTWSWPPLHVRPTTAPFCSVYVQRWCVLSPGGVPSRCLPKKAMYNVLFPLFSISSLLTRRIVVFFFLFTSCQCLEIIFHA